MRGGDAGGCGDKATRGQDREICRKQEESGYDRRTDGGAVRVKGILLDAKSISAVVVGKKERIMMNGTEDVSEIQLHPGEHNLCK